MNEHLSGRGSLDAGAVAYMKNAGLSRVESCDDARRYIELQHEYLDARSTEVVAPTPGTDIDPGSDLGPTDGSTDKVADGMPSFLRSIVRVQVWNGSSFGTCSGVLINTRVLLSAARCFVADGYYDLRVDQGRPQGGNGASSMGCLSGGNSCSNSPSGLNARVFRYPGFGGTGDTRNDLAVVINNTPWAHSAPSHPEELPFTFEQLTENAPGVGHMFTVAGFGAHASTGSGLGIRRESITRQQIDTSFSGYWRCTVDQGVGRPCRGDEGSPAINSSTSGSAMAFGLFSNFSGQGPGGFCNNPGDYFRYTRVDDKLAFVNNMLIFNAGMPACRRESTVLGWNYRVCF
jgi:hypothetical protein